MKHYRIFLLSAFLICTSQLFAQKNLYYQLQNDYQKGLELYNKQKYSSALVFFNAIVEQSPTGERTIEKTNAEFYLALCAIHLSTDDAELQLEKFLQSNPESILKTTACFEMGKYMYDNKKYKKAIGYFHLVDKNALSKEEKAEFFFKSGYSYFLIDSLDKARIAFFEIKDIDNRYAAPAIYYYSHIAYSQKNYETALQGFTRLTDDETFSSIVPYYIAQCHYFQKKYDALITFAEPIIDSVTPSRAGEMAKLIADAYFFKENYKKALPFFERYVKSVPSISLDDQYQIGYCYYKTGEYNKAINYFEKASVGDSPAAQNALYHLADCYVKTDNKKMARMAFEGASRMNYNDKIKEDALFNYAVVTYELLFSPFNEAIKAFTEYITLYPTSERSDEAYQYLMNAYLNTRNYKDALAYIEKIKIKDKDIRKAYQKIAYYRGLELFNNQRYSEAIQLFATSLQHGEFDSEIKAKCYFWTGESNYRLNQTEDALTNYTLFQNYSKAENSREYALVHYNIGYIYFNNKKMSEAATSFKKYISIAKNEKSDFVADAANRIGDCFFDKKQYSDALEYYTKSIVIGLSNKDYAIFQKGFTLGIQGKYDQKISYLNQLCSEFPESPYVDDAVYEIGNSYLLLQQNNKAIDYFSKIISDYSTSTYVKKALLQLGIIRYNLDNNTEAMAAYKKLVAEYPGTPEAKSALMGIKNIYIEMNDVDGYIQYTESLGQFANVSLAEQDSLTYIAGENFYMQGDCAKAMENFNKYIQKFSDGSFILNTWFYKAECHNRNKEYKQAQEGYSFVINRQRNNFTESSLLASGRIFMADSNYQAATEVYVKLEEQAELPNNILEARIQLTKAYYQLKEYANVITAGKKLMTTDKLPPETLRRTRYMLVKSYLATNNPIFAEEECKKLSDEIISPEGAEAKYILADLYFKQNELEKAENIIFDFAEKNSPQQFWVGKSFLLLSDIYTTRKDEFQATQTLQSIIENYELSNDGIIDTAKEKLAAIQAKQTKAPGTDTTEINIQVK